MLDRITFTASSRAQAPESQVCPERNQTLVNSLLSLSIYPLRSDARFVIARDGDGCGPQVGVEVLRRRNVLSLNDLFALGDQLRERNVCDFPVDI
jgi:hypothetical protein